MFPASNMELQLLLIITLFPLLFVASNSALSPEAYWNSILPNTAMPKAVKDILKAEWAENKITSISVGNGGIHLDSGIAGLFSCINAASETQLHDSTNKAIFFLEKDLKPTKRMNGSFLARSDDEKLPFSSDKMTMSEEDQMIGKITKERDQEPAVKEEEKYCATSLESMVDFITSKLGKHVRAISTEVNNGTKLQNYLIIQVTKLKGNENVVCHKHADPYAVFYCQNTHTTEVYTVFMTGANGSKVDAVAVCHTDTSAWNHEHLAFQVLRILPGTFPVCHFLPEDHIVWVAN